MKRWLTVIVAMSVLFSCNVKAEEPVVMIENCGMDSVMARMKRTSLADIEGIWRFVPDGAAVAIEKSKTRTGEPSMKYTIFIVESVNPNVEEGTVIGHVYPSASVGTYTAELYSDVHGNVAGKKKNFILKLSDPGHLSVTQKKSGVRLDFWRWIPYLFRVSVVRERQSSTTGCIRLYPRVVEAVSEPIYL